MALHGSRAGGNHSSGVKRRSHLLHRQEEEAIGTLYRLSNRPISPRSQVEQEKRIRREIANSNERRRMQSINTGFNSLRTMLPKHDGEKLSKAAILQHTAEYIYQLEQDKTRLLQEICQIKRMPIEEIEEASTANKRVKTEQTTERKPLELCNSDFSDEGIHCQPSPKDTQSISSGGENELSADELRAELVQVRNTLNRERRLRMQLEDQVRALESQLYPERIKEIANQVQLQFQSHQREDQGNLISDETITAVSSVVSDEVVAETIEIETHSCPGSPIIQPTTIVIQSAGSEGMEEVEEETGSQRVEDLTCKVKDVRSSGAKVGKAAIALPIDVPFIGGEDENGGQITLQIINSTPESTTYEATTSSSGSTSRQNLDTIVEAIRHLEGDHCFRDDNEGGPQTVVLKQVKSEEGSDEKTVRTVLTVSPQQLGAIRQQVIQCLPLQSRPGVIVANHT